MEAPVTHFYDYGEGGPTVPAHPEIAEIKNAEPGVFDTHGPSPVDLTRLPDHVRGLRYVAQCSKCARWCGAHDFTRIICSWCNPVAYNQEVARHRKLPAHTIESLTALALARSEEILVLKAKLADVTKERDHYHMRIKTAIRKLEGW